MRLLSCFIRKLAAPLIFASFCHLPAFAQNTDATSVTVSPYRHNAVKRSLAESLGDRVSVKDFGARGNGQTDDTQAVQAAIYAVCDPPGGSAPWGSGGAIFFPPGVYSISSVKFPCNGVSLIGANNGNTNSGSLDWRGTVFKLTTQDRQTAFAVGMTTADYGGGIHVSHASIDGSMMAPTATVFDFSWLQHSSIEDISARDIPNFYREEGGAANSLTDITIMNLSGTGIEFFGDASQCQGPHLASCNKRADLLRVTRVNMNGTDNHTATCFSYHDFAQSLNVDHAICENARYGIGAYCSAAQGHNGEACPAFARFHDFEAENCTYCVDASDIQDWEFSNGYFLGEGKNSPHVIRFVNQNYAAPASKTDAGTYAEAVRFHGGRIGNSGRSAIYIGISDFIIEGGQVFSSNLSDTTGQTGAPNIEIAGTESITMPTRGLIYGNILCEASGQQPLYNPNIPASSGMNKTDAAPPALVQGSIWLNLGVTNVKVFGNETSRCSSGPQDFNKSGNNVIGPF